MKLTRSMLRQFATATSRSNGTATRTVATVDGFATRSFLGVMGSSTNNSSVSYFCTGASPDLPPMTSGRSFSSKATLLDNPRTFSGRLHQQHSHFERSFAKMFPEDPSR